MAPTRLAVGDPSHIPRTSFHLSTRLRRIRRCTNTARKRSKFALLYRRRAGRPHSPPPHEGARSLGGARIYPPVINAALTCRLRSIILPALSPIWLSYEIPRYRPRGNSSGVRVSVGSWRNGSNVLTGPAGRPLGRPLPRYEWSPPCPPGYTSNSLVYKATDRQRNPPASVAVQRGPCKYTCSSNWSGHDARRSRPTNLAPYRARRRAARTSPRPDVFFVMPTALPGPFPARRSPEVLL